MASGWGGARGASRQAREVSPTASLSKLPASSSDDAAQGGEHQDRLNPSEPPETGRRRAVGSPPSRPDNADSHSGQRLPPVETVADPADRGPVEVRVPPPRSGASSEIDPSNTNRDHETQESSGDVDEAAMAFWDEAYTVCPPMTAAAVDAVALIVRRIDQRRAR